MSIDIIVSTGNDVSVPGELWGMIGPELLGELKKSDAELARWFAEAASVTLVDLREECSETIGHLFSGSIRTARHFRPRGNPFLHRHARSSLRDLILLLSRDSRVGPRLIPPSIQDASWPYKCVHESALEFVSCYFSDAQSARRNLILIEETPMYVAADATPRELDQLELALSTLAESDLPEVREAAHRSAARLRDYVRE